MAISQRNPIPVLIAIGGLMLFFYFGFSSDRQSDIDNVPARPSTANRAANPPIAEPTLDEKRIDAVAFDAANEADSDDVPDDGDVPERLPEQDQRLDLSGASAVSKTQQTRGLKSYNGLYDLTFDDVKFDLEPDEPFSRDKLSEEIRQINGKQIKIRGYIRPSFSQRGLKNFVFVRDNQECCFGPNAAIYDCMLVKLKKQTTTDYTVRPVTVEGTFYLKPFQGPDGNTWAIYRMKNATVK